MRSAGHLHQQASRTLATPCVSPSDRHITPLDIVVLHPGEASTNNVVKVGSKAVSGWHVGVVVGGPWPAK